MHQIQYPIKNPISNPGALLLHSTITLLRNPIIVHKDICFHGASFSFKEVKDTDLQRLFNKVFYVWTTHVGFVTYNLMCSLVKCRDIICLLQCFEIF